MTPWRALVCSRRRQWADRHLLPFPWTLFLHRPLTALCPSSPSLAYLSLSTYLSFPLGGCANGAPGLSLFPCRVHTEEGNCPRRQSFAKGGRGGGGLPPPPPPGDPESLEALKKIFGLN